MASTHYTDFVGPPVNAEWLNDVNDYVYGNRGLLQEIQTASAGQTVFVLHTVVYTPNTNNLSVYVDGLNQYGPGAQFAYTETNSVTVTFNQGLHAGASVKFTTAVGQATATVAASNVSYTAPGSGATPTNVAAKLAQTVSVKDFGAVGDGVTDDTAAFNNAWTASNPQAVYVPAGTYEISTSATGKFYSFGVVTINTGSVTSITNLVT